MHDPMNKPRLKYLNLNGLHIVRECECGKQYARFRWSPLWCPDCDEVRVKRITRRLENLEAKMQGQQMPELVWCGVCGGTGRLAPENGPTAACDYCDGSGLIEQMEEEPAHEARREGKSGVGKLAGKMAVRDLHTVIKVIQKEGRRK